MSLKEILAIEHCLLRKISSTKYLWSVVMSNNKVLFSHRICFPLFNIFWPLFHSIRRGVICAGLVLLFFLSSTVEGKPIIMLDSGHGGSNTGAYAPGAKVFEKKLTLNVALATKNYLMQWIPNAQVLLTRTDDSYLTLKERVHQANEQNVDVFVSIHFNASETKSQQGFETFILSKSAADQESTRMANVENEDLIGTGDNTIDHDKKRAVVKSILSDLHYVGAHAESLELAKSLGRQLEIARGKSKNRGVRQAPFDVLLGLKMPGVLVEAGFVDHPIEGKEITTLIAQEYVALALAAGMADFCQKRFSSSVQR